MNESILAATLGLVAAVGWGVSGFFDAKASRSVHPIVASLTVNGLLTVVYTICYFLFLHQNDSCALTGILYASAGGAIIAIGALTYFTALSIGPISLASPMSSAYPLVTTVLAVAVFGATLSVEQGIAIGLIILGIFLVTEFLQIILRRKTIHKGPLFGLITAVCWGVGYALVAQAVQINGWQHATLVELLAMMLAFGVCIAFLKDKRKVSISTVRQALRNKNIIAASLVALVAALSFNSGFMYDTTGGAAVVSLSAFYPVLTVLLALRHFDEKVRKVQLVGAAASIIGVIGITTL